jgi:hypothetical protein
MKSVVCHSQHLEPPISLTEVQSVCVCVWFFVSVFINAVHRMLKSNNTIFGTGQNTIRNVFCLSYTLPVYGIGRRVMLQCDNSQCQ